MVLLLWYPSTLTGVPLKKRFYSNSKNASPKKRARLTLRIEKQKGRAWAIRRHGWRRDRQQFGFCVRTISLGLLPFIGILFFRLFAVLVDSSAGSFYSSAVSIGGVDTLGLSAAEDPSKLGKCAT